MAARISLGVKRGHWHNFRSLPGSLASLAVTDYPQLYFTRNDSREVQPEKQATIRFSLGDFVLRSNLDGNFLLQRPLGRVIVKEGRAGATRSFLQVAFSI